jgi:hypothetical protein
VLVGDEYSAAEQVVSVDEQSSHPGPFICVSLSPSDDSGQQFLVNAATFRYQHISKEFG